MVFTSSSRSKPLGRIACVAVATLGLSSAARAQLPGLQKQVSAEVERLAPVFSFDDDSCYPAAAISPSGELNRGLKVGGSITGECREPSQLREANTYARRVEVRIDGKVFSATMYSLYFEKDQIAPLAGGHRHDFEAVVLWQTDGVLTHAAFSAHGGFALVPTGELVLRGGRVAAVYHKDWYVTHCFRQASRSDVDSARSWYTPTPVEWDLMDAGLRGKLAAGDFGKAIVSVAGDYYYDLLGRCTPPGYPPVEIWRPGGKARELRQWYRGGARNRSDLHQWHRDQREMPSRPSDRYRRP